MQPKHTKILSMLYTDNFGDLAECLQRAPGLTLAPVLRRLEMKVEEFRKARRCSR